MRSCEIYGDRIRLIKWRVSSPSWPFQPCFRLGIGSGSETGKSYSGKVQVQSFRSPTKVGALHPRVFGIRLRFERPAFR